MDAASHPPGSDKPLVFISYNRRSSSEFAKELCQQIKEWGHTTWVDFDQISPESTYYDGNWTEAIAKAIRDCEVVIGVITPDALRSRWVPRELRMAERVESLIIPLKHEPYAPEDIDKIFWLEDYEHVDFTGDANAAFAKLRRMLDEVAGRRVSPVERSPVQAEAPATTTTPDPRDDDQGRNLRRFLPMGLRVRNEKLRRYQELENRLMLIANVQEAWIDGVLAQLVATSLVELSISARPDARLARPGLPPLEVATGVTAYQIFHDLHRELLVLGAPGSGKTVFLLQIAEELLRIARERNDAEWEGRPIADDAPLRIPVVIPLAGWTPQHSLKDWVIDEMQLSYEVPPDVAGRWLDEDLLVLLLDGFDEVNPDYRPACLEAINAYRDEHPLTDWVICSRIMEYEALSDLGARLSIQAAIELQPLSDEQVQSVLAGEQYAALLQVMTEDPVLTDVLTNPFLLSAASVAYRDRPATNLRLTLSGSGDADLRRRHIINGYLERRLDANSTTATFTRRQILHFLPRIAARMQRVHTTILHIERIDPRWLTTPGQRLAYLLMSRAIVIGLTALSVGLATGVTFNLRAGVAVGVAMMIAVPVAYVLAAPARIRLRTAYGATTRGVIGIAFGLAAGFSSLVSVGLGALLIAPLLLPMLKEKGPKDVEIVENVRYLWFRMVVATMGATVVFFLVFSSFPGEVFALVDALLLGTAFGVFSGVSGSERVGRSTRPNQGIWQTLQAVSSWVLRLTVVAITVITITLSEVLLFGEIVLFAVALAIMVAFSFGGIGTVNHLCLRIVLLRDIPWKLARFLEQMVELRLMRRVGGSFIFVHRYVMEHIASRVNTR